jgi:uncharacterized protein (TIGR02266 family)
MDHSETATETREERAEAEFRLLSEVAPAPTAAGNRRIAPRMAVELDVSITSDHNFYAGFTENMSEGGVFIATHLLKPVGSIVDISIFLPQTNKEVRGKGEVRWIREFSEASNVPPGMGIRFVELQPGSLDAINEFLACRDPLFFDDE